MRYLAPGSLKEALDILRREDDARCIAGGATLVAMMNADLVAVEVLVVWAVSPNFPASPRRMTRSGSVP